ncbi:DUF2490 domain-containing protein [Winogradskyella sp. F6397]|uniref:DUF2490 domain-containing protein n=1 Tax=Winogradskyella marina TaxID=2785530 RepID=A0ABS0EL99_9FLAO|nr:DUF2490 domain-containing protein [Winogradskyella marina]MBF8150901.1 DUF2490 domain-containing protein [Winogradskyella marina]
MKNVLYTVFIFMLFQSVLLAQKNSEDYFGAWYTLGINHRFTEQFSLTPYAELRLYKPTSNYNLTFASLNGNYHFKKNQTITVAYAYLDIDSVFDTDNVPNTIEHRILEQYAIKHNFKALNIQHRFRFEQRFLEKTAGNELQNRFRYRLSLQYPINKTVYLALKDEGFINFQDQVFHENRFFVGFGVHILKNTQLHIDYLKHHIRNNSLNRIQIGLSIKTDSRKPKTSTAQQ